MNKNFFSDCQQRLNDFICEWQKLIAKNKNFLIYGIIWCIISFGFELFQYTESIDDEVFQLPNSFKFWAIQGRFTYGYVLQCFFGSLSVPFFALFFSQLCMLAAYIFAFIGKQEVKGTLHYIAMPLFISAPILFYGYAFNILTPIIGLGFLFSIISVKLFQKRRWWSVLLGLCSGVIAIGCYQVFLPVLILFLLFQLIRMLDDASFFKSFFRESLFHLTFAAGCYGCYAVTLKVILYCNKLQMSSYITDMVAFNSPWSILVKNGCKILEYIWKIYAGSPRIYSERISFLLPLTALLILLLVWNKIVRNTNFPLWKKISYLVILTVIIFTPFLFFFIGIARLLIRCRTALAVALVLPFLFTETWKIVKTRTRFVLLIFAGLCLLQFLYVNSKFSYICYLREKQDDHITQYILNQLLPESSQWPENKVFVYFQGHLPISQIKDQFIGGKPIDENTAVSIFNDGFNRFHYLLKKKLYSNMEIMPPNLFPMIEDELKKMPCYPQKGFAKFVNGIAVVKMAENMPIEVRRFSKYKYSITETKNISNCYITTPDDAGIGKKIWQGSRSTMQAGNDVILNFKNDFEFTAKGVGSDPGIQFIKLPENAPENICLRLKYASPNVDLIQIYFYTVTPANTLVGGHVYFSASAGEHDISLVMPSSVFNYTYFRLDPGLLNSNINFDNISIHEYHPNKGK